MIFLWELFLFFVLFSFLLSKITAEFVRPLDFFLFYLFQDVAFIVLANENPVRPLRKICGCAERKTAAKRKSPHPEPLEKKKRRKNKSHQII